MDTGTVSQEEIKVRWSSLALSATLGLVFAGITGFVFLNSFEVLLNRDIPFIHAIDRIHSGETMRSIVGDDTRDVLDKKSQEAVGNFGLPKTLKIPTLGSRLPLMDAIFVDGQWLSRSNSGHYLITSAGKNGNIGNVVVYTRVGWRTISAPENIKIGDNIFLDTDTDWRYMFRVDNKSALQFGQPFVKSETSFGSLIFLVEDDARKADFVFEGVFVGIQNIRQ